VNVTTRTVGELCNLLTQTVITRMRSGAPRALARREGKHVKAL
jgi:hypothetical protein